MKFISYALLLFISLALTACGYGDKANSLTAEFESAESFENKDFAGNKIEAAEFTEPCAYIDEADIMSMLSAPVEKINTQPDQQTKRCVYTIIYDQGPENPEYTRGSISIHQEVTGVEAEWKDNWSVKKAISKSSEWVPNLGKAAIWKGSSLQLEVKFEGYSLYVSAPRGPGNDESKSKEWAIKMVKLAGFV